MDRRSFLGTGLSASLGAGFYAALLGDAKAAGTSRAPKLKIREVRAIRLTGERGRQWIEERREKRVQAEKDRPELVRAILAGKLHLNDVDRNRVDFVMLEDEVAQTGQGVIAVRSNEHLGGSDRGVFLLRKIWERELRNLAEGQPIKQWTYRPEMVPTYPQG